MRIIALTFLLSLGLVACQNDSKAGGIRPKTAAKTQKDTDSSNEDIEDGNSDASNGAGNSGPQMEWNGRGHVGNDLYKIIPL